MDINFCLIVLIHRGANDVSFFFFLGLWFGYFIPIIVGRELIGLVKGASCGREEDLRAINYK